MPTCPSHDELHALLTERLDPAGTAAVESHVEGCPRCQASLCELAAATPLPLRTAETPVEAWRPSDDLLRRLESAAAAPPEVPRVPGYEVVRQLGRGGMGVVYEAVHQRLGRRVALKVLRAEGEAEPQLLARFRGEAESAARLQHPSIVQVYEVGQWDGRQYLALELVEGGSLAQRLAGQPQPPEAAAELIEALARAMDYAHEQGVVHRDLKPANVLLAGGGVASGDWSKTTPIATRHSPLANPKVTDFGLAKRLDVSAAGLTETGQILGTPGYMAPEQAQARGGTVGPAADIYALGAILYECLTGRPPFVAATNLDAVLQLLAEEPVPPRRLNPTAPRDLETVCLKCLEKEPHRRYARAADLADDLRRFRAGEPVRARPVGIAGRTAKWVRRQPALAAALAVAIAATVGGGALVTVKWREAVANAVEAKEKQALAEERAEDASQRWQLAFQAVRRVVTDIQSQLKDKPGQQELRKKLLKNALEDLRALARNAERTARSPTAPAAVDRVLVNSLWEMGEIFKDIEVGGMEEAGRLFELARDLSQRLAAANPGDADVAQSILKVRLSLGEVYEARGDPRANEWYRACVADTRAWAEARPNDADARQQLARALHAWGSFLGIADVDTDAAVSACQESWEILQQLTDAAPREATVRKHAVSSLLNLAKVRFRRKEMVAARDAFTRGRDALAEFLVADPDNVDLRYKLCGAWSYLGEIDQRARALKPALASYQNALAEAKRLAADDPTNVAALRGLATAWQQIANIHQDLGDRGAALEACRTCRDAFQRLADLEPTVVRSQDDVAKIDIKLAGLYRLGGDNRASVEAYGRALAIREKLAQAHPHIVGVQSEYGLTWIWLGEAQHAQGDHSAAAESARQAIAVFIRLTDANPKHVELSSRLAKAWGLQANIDLSRGGGKAAEPAFRRALEIFGQIAAADPGNLVARRDMAVTFNKLARVQYGVGDFAAALDLGRQGHALLRQMADAAPDDMRAWRDLGQSLSLIADFERASGQLQPALESFRRYMEILERYPVAAGVKQERDLDFARGKIGEIELQLGNAEAALAAFRPSLALWQRLAAAEPNNANTRFWFAEALERVGDATRQLGDSRSALDSYRQALDLRRRLAAADPKHSDFQVKVALVRFKLGHAAQDEADCPMAQEQYRTALALLNELGAEKRLANPRQFEPLKRDAEARLTFCAAAESALADPSEALKQPDDVAAPLLAARAVGLARQGKHAEAVAAANLAAERAGSDGRRWFDAARAVALCVPSVDAPERKSQYAARAVELLGQAVRHGFDKSARLRHDPAFAALRDRPDWDEVMRKIVRAAEAGH